MEQQQSLFHELQHGQTHMVVATVVFGDQPPGQYDYFLPPPLVDRVHPGMRVWVPLGPANRRKMAYCIAVQSRPVEQKLKPVLAPADDYVLLSEQMLQLTRWMADYYMCPLGQVLEAVLPAPVRHRKKGRAIQLLYPTDKAAAVLESGRLPPKQLMALRALVASDGGLTAAELTRMAGCSLAPINALLRKGLIRAETARPVPIVNGTADTKRPKKLTAEQAEALKAIKEALAGGPYRVVLIHGVTSSGKTEVYIRAAELVVSRGKQVIVLVPEISLTPQTVDRFRRRFPAVAVLHSNLSDAERYWHWRQIAEGRVPVVVGARSAVFAPTPKLGLIVVDEEHETSFKQETTPRYHARDVAIMRAELEGIPIVLGSATPSLESWYRARTGRYKLVKLTRRVEGRPLPPVSTIDLRSEEHMRTTRGIVSRQLHMAIRQALDEGGQVILLLNRRGFATHIQCPACGHVVRCPHCDIALTHHRVEGQAVCHYCDYRIPAPEACPACRYHGIRFSGVGTQRLETEIANRFPDVSVLRMDADSMRKRGAHQKALAAFHKGEARILLGTQMIAKGLDFPNVTLVGVINADTALHLPDFRAAERTFQLVTQVAGRTGRGEKGGRVLVQTYNPEHPAIQAAVHHDYERFAEHELPVRQLFAYPPFAHMIRIVVRSDKKESARFFAECLAERLKHKLSQFQAKWRLLGPAPCPFEKLRGKYRFHIQLQSPRQGILHETVKTVQAELDVPKDVEWIVDVDPVDML